MGTFEPGAAPTPTCSVLGKIYAVWAEKAMAPHSSTLVWKIPWTEEPGRLKSMGSRRVRHDWVTSLSFSLLCMGEGNGNPLQCSCLENPRDGVAQSRTRLKWLSSMLYGHSLVAQTVESACNAGHLGSIPGLGRSPEEGNGNLLQYSCLENPMDGGAWQATYHGVAKSWTQLSDFTFTSLSCSPWRPPAPILIQL